MVEKEGGEGMAADAESPACQALSTALTFGEA